MNALSAFSRSVIRWTHPRSLAVVVFSFCATVQFATPAHAQAPTPFGGIITKDYGLGCGPCAPEILKVEFDAVMGALRFEVSNADGCPGQVILAHYVLYGTGFKESPVAMPEPGFSPDCVLLLEPQFALGPFGGTVSLVDIPADPALLGTPIYVQAMSIDWGVGISGTVFRLSQMTLLLFV